MKESKKRTKTTTTLNRSGIRRVVMILLFTLIQACILFAAAGHINIPRAWIYFAIVLGYYTVSMIFIFYRFPEMLELVNERGKKQKGVLPWDKILALLYTLMVLILPAVAGLDIGRFQWSALSKYCMIPGTILFILASLLVHWAMLVNRHFETMVRIQDDREHRVISDGPYAFVRHPGYVGIIALYTSFPLIVGSFYSFIPAGVIMVLFVIRTALEDNTLKKELSGYSDYTGRVRYRLFPGIW